MILGKGTTIYAAARAGHFTGDPASTNYCPRSFPLADLFCSLFWIRFASLTFFFIKWQFTFFIIFFFGNNCLPQLKKKNLILAWKCPLLNTFFLNFFLAALPHPQNWLLLTPSSQSPTPPKDFQLCSVRCELPLALHSKPLGETLFYIIFFFNVCVFTLCAPLTRGIFPLLVLLFAVALPLYLPPPLGVAHRCSVGSSVLAAGPQRPRESFRYACASPSFLLSSPFRGPADNCEEVTAYY